VADRRVLYPAWGPVFDRARPLLLPFHLQPGLVTHVTGAPQLRAALARPPAELARPTSGGRAAAEEQLGPVDGRASARVLEVLRRHAGGGPKGVVRPKPRLLGRAAALATAAPGIRAAGAVAGRSGNTTHADAAQRRSEQWLQEGREALALLRRW